MTSDGEHPRTEAERAVDEAERLVDHRRVVSSQEPQSIAADGFIALFAAMMALCLVVFVAWFVAIPMLGVLPGVVVAVALRFAHTAG